jgi:hypothetical protein
MCVAQCGVVATVDHGRFTKVPPDSEHPNGGIRHLRYESANLVLGRLKTTCGAENR